MGPPGRRAHGCWEDTRATLETHAPSGEEKGEVSPARMIEHRALANSPSIRLPRRTDERSQSVSMMSDRNMPATVMSFVGRNETTTRSPADTTPGATTLRYAPGIAAA